MKKILCVLDVPNWIFRKHFLELEKRLTEFEFTAIYRHEVHTKPKSFYDVFDCIYIFDTRLGIPYNLKDKTCIGLRNEFIYAHDKNSIAAFYKSQVENRAKIFHVVNMHQYSEFKNANVRNVRLVQHGVDLDVINNQLAKHDKLVVGTKGSPGSGGNKGFDIVEAACRKLNIELRTAYQRVNQKQILDMPDFYDEIDVYCNMSASEGLNNSILEAGSMRKIVVASNVGAAPEMIFNEITGFICDRSIDALVEVLNLIKQNKEECFKLGEELRKLIVDKFNWNVRIDGFKQMFEDTMT